MRLIFMGTPQPVVPVLEKLIQEHDVVMVITQPPRPSGRNRKVAPSPVQGFADSRGLHVIAPETLKAGDPGVAEVQRAMAATNAEAVVTASYGLFLPLWVRDLSPLGAVNIHPSLLPKYRGASPVVSAILAGEKETGVSIFRIEKEMDAGPLLGLQKLSLDGTERAGELTERLFEMGGDLLLEVLEKLEGGAAVPAPQNHAEATYSSKTQKSDGVIDWTESAEMIFRRIRAYDPWPACRTTYGGMELTIWSAVIKAGAASPGAVFQVESEGITVGTGEGLLVLTELQRSGKRRMTASEFLRGVPIEKGRHLGAELLRD